MNIEDIPPDVAKKVAEKNRGFLTDYDWWECEVDHFKKDMAAVGIHVERAYFSGFWSQGDGACFEGHVSDWGKFLSSLGYTCPFMIALADDYWNFKSEHRGYYCHHKSVGYTSVVHLPDSDEDEDFIKAYLGIEEELRASVALNELLKHDTDKLDTEFREAFEGHMQDLYRRLEREYDHQTSDQAVLEALDANDLLEEEVNALMENEHA